jgi:hypothetical protein
MSVQSSQNGPVAQLGARLNGIQEVTGSIPVRSTKPSSPASYPPQVAEDRCGYGGSKKAVSVLIERSKSNASSKRFSLS